MWKALHAKGKTKIYAFPPSESSLHTRISWIRALGISNDKLLFSKEDKGLQEKMPTEHNTEVDVSRKFLGIRSIILA